MLDRFRTCGIAHEYQQTNRRVHNSPQLIPVSLLLFVYPLIRDLLKKELNAVLCPLTLSQPYQRRRSRVAVSRREQRLVCAQYGHDVNGVEVPCRKTRHENEETTI